MPVNPVDIVHREVIYSNLFNSRTVERIQVQTSPPSCKQNFILKTHVEQKAFDRELWADRIFLPRIPAVKTPRIVDAFYHDERFWLILEDLGRTSSVLSRETMLAAAQLIHFWHDQPLSLIPHDFDQQMPYIDDAMERLRKRWDALEDILKLSSTQSSIRALYNELNNIQIFPTKMVVSHGDYHPLNVFRRDGQVFVLDWELIQINSEFWDLYNLLDMTSPHFERGVLGKLRDDLLAAYASQMGKSVADFTTVYRRYASLYSAWLLLLIEDDLQSNRFEASTLMRQRMETFAVLHDCVHLSI